MSKSLKIIQTLAKIFKVLSQIAFVCCIIGICGCVIGLLSFATGFTSIQVGDVTIQNIIETEAGMSVGTIISTMISGIIVCAAELFVAMKAKTYFKHEIEAGTPFTKEGAKEFRNYGIINIIVCIGSSIVMGITKLICSLVFENVGAIDTDIGLSIGTGLLILVISVIFQYGAEVQESKNTVEEKAE